MKYRKNTVTLYKSKNFPCLARVRLLKFQHGQFCIIRDCMGLMFQAGLSWGCFTNLFSSWCRAVGLNWLYSAVYYFRKFLKVSENRLPALLPKNFRLGFLMNLSESCLVCFTTPQNHPSTHIRPLNVQQATHTAPGLHFHGMAIGKPGGLKSH